MDLAFLRREFASVRQVATFENGISVSDDEEGAQVFAVSGLRSSAAGMARLPGLLLSRH